MAKKCDVDWRYDFYGLTKAADTAIEQGGEVLVSLRWRRVFDNLPVPLQLQLIEIDWLDDAKSGAYNGNTIINGMEYDMLGAVAAYRLFDQHPGQGRGFTRFASVISRVRDLQLYEDDELARKNLETRLSVLAKGEMSQMENPASLSGAGEQGQGARDLGYLGGSTVVGVPAGINFTVAEPKEAPGYVAGPDRL